MNQENDLVVERKKRGRKEGQGERKGNKKEGRKERAFICVAHNKQKS